MICLGIDQSTSTFGYAFTGENHEYLGGDTLKPPNKIKTSQQRLLFFYSAVVDLIVKIKEHPQGDVVVVAREGYLKNLRFAKTPFQLGEIGGVVDLAFAQHGFIDGSDWFAPAQGSWLKFLTGKGRSPFTSEEKRKKPQEYIEYLNKFFAAWNLQTFDGAAATTDLVDAFAIAVCIRSFYHIYRGAIRVADLTRTKAEVVIDEKKLKKRGLDMKSLAEISQVEQPKILRKMT